MGATFPGACDIPLGQVRWSMLQTGNAVERILPDSEVGKIDI